ncbi:hypothetical protein [Marinicella sp. W31]|uniref:hypothetical protein n=1 Tax=Marinicella sp. W31 TaxID=3023713 RepID=UPI0037574ADB
MNILNSHYSHVLSSVVCVFLLMGTENSIAHPDASDPQFCYRGEIIEAGVVELTGESLATMLRNKPVDCPVGIRDVKNDPSSTNKELREYISGVIVYRNPVKRHDFFDYTPARIAYGFASCMCSTMVNEDIDPAQIRPLLLAPEILLDEMHHEDYELSDGLKFSCQVCK